MNRFPQEFGEDFLHLLWKGIDSLTPWLYLKSTFKVFMGDVLTLANTAEALRGIDL